MYTSTDIVILCNTYFTTAKQPVLNKLWHLMGKRRFAQV